MTLDGVRILSFRSFVSSWVQDWNILHCWYLRILILVLRRCLLILQRRRRYGIIRGELRGLLLSETETTVSHGHAAWMLTIKSIALHSLSRRLGRRLCRCFLFAPLATTPVDDGLASRCTVRRRRPCRRIGRRSLRRNNRRRGIASLCAARV